jgi:cytochrome c oxidase assembly protein subunit 11
MEKNKKTMFILTGVGVAMLGLGFASDPLYDTFCRITGYGGTPQIAEDNFSEVIDRTVTVKFDSNVASGLPWDFKPDQRSMDIKVGQSGLAYYTVRNESDVPLVGVASFNVTPIKAAPYFVKTDCFCFEEQTIQPGQELPLPVLFFIDSQLDEEKRLDDVKEITLSYTFFETDEEAQIATQSSGSNAEVELD